MSDVRLVTPHGEVCLPAFLPDATRAVVRALDSHDVEATGAPALVVSVYHLALRPGIQRIRQLGGIHRFIGWNHPVVSDSGGFQVFSLLRNQGNRGSLSSEGAIFHTEQGDKKRLTPEKSIVHQLRLGSDILFCFDDCTHPEDPFDEQTRSVQRTLVWARRSKETFERIVAEREGGVRPQLFAVIQGGNSRELRRRCADVLREIGFDGFGFGGWPIAGDGALVDDILAYTAELMPDGLPKFALGIGTPASVVRCYRMGYRLFDSSFPTRDGRRGRLYSFVDGGDGPISADLPVEYIYLRDQVHHANPRPVDPRCDCLLCRRYSRAYLHHLFRVDDGLAARLGTIHNLRFMSRLVARLAKYPSLVNHCSRKE